MPRLVMKFGGTSICDSEHVNNVARLVMGEVKNGYEVIAAVSAQAGETNRLVALTREIAPLHDLREYDAVLAAGEQVSAGLLAMALQREGVSARSWLGWQLPIHTNAMHGAARIEGVETKEIEAQLAEGRVAVVAGFQGLGHDNRITTLGRGGSDTTAVALAAAFGAERCDIYTDVKGVYSADPNIVPKAGKLAKISHEEMMEMASLGAKVLQIRAVEMAMKYGVQLRVLSSFAKEDNGGTLIVMEEENMEQLVVSGIAYAHNEAKITLRSVPDKPGIAAKIFGALGKTGINIDMIVQNISSSKHTDITFTIDSDEMVRALEALESLRGEVELGEIEHIGSMAKVSIIGVGMRSHSGVAQKMFEVFAKLGVNIHVISTSEIKVSVLIDEKHARKAVKALHEAFGLDKD